MPKLAREESTDVDDITGADVTKLIPGTDIMSVYIVGSVTGFFLILLFCVIVLLIKSRISRKRSQELFHFESLDDSSTCKSAPISRKNSPKPQKRLSCPNAYGSLEGAYVQTSVFESIPTQQMPPLAVQPKLSDNLPSQVTSSFHKLNIESSEPTTYHSENELYAASSIYSSDKALSTQPELLFTAVYDVTSQQLVVTLIKVKDIPARAGNTGLRDPFVKIVVLPDDYIYKTSKTIRQSSNPVFNETFTFNIPKDNLKSNFLKFSVYDIDRRRVRYALGHVTVPLGDLDVTSPVVHTRHLEHCLQSGSSSGEIHIGLVYLPHLLKMKVIILQVRNIRPSKPDSGLLVRLQHFNGKKPLKVKQTLVQRSGEDTNFNESFAFSTSNRNIENFNFTVTVYESSRDGSFDDVELGHVNLGSFMFARGNGLIHWQEMMTKTRSVVSKWHPLVLQI